MKDESRAAGQVPGERDVSAVVRERPAASRAGSILAVGLMSLLAAGLLIWYYANALTRQSGVRQKAQEIARRRAQGDAPLPPLGPILPPETPAAQPASSGAPPVPAGEFVELPQPPSLPQIAGMSAGVAAAPQPVVPSPLERQLAGVAFAAQQGFSAVAGSPPAVQAGPIRVTGVAEPAVSASGASGTLSTLLRPGVSTAVNAEILPSMQLLLPKGAFLDCTLETAIDSTLPGMTTCITATDTFGADGKVVLLERGTKLVGETRGQVQQGAARVFVIWDEARTPTGVVVPLASPGADELGRAGLPGEVNRHFWERFGAAMLITVLDGAVQTAVPASTGGSTVVLNPAASENVATEILKGTVAIAPTIQKAHGDRIQVMVARDLDFRPVYALRTAAGEH